MKGVMLFFSLSALLLFSCGETKNENDRDVKSSKISENEIRSTLTGNGESAIAWQLVSKTNDAGESKMTNFSKSLVCTYNADGTFQVTANNGTKEVATGTFKIKGAIIYRKYDNKQDMLEVTELTPSSFSVMYPLAGGYMTDKYEKL